MDSFCNSRLHVQTGAERRCSNDVQTRALIQERAARMDNTNSMHAYPGFTETRPGALPILANQPRADIHQTWHPSRWPNQFGPLPDFPIVQQSLKLSRDEQDALDGLLMLGHPTDMNVSTNSASFPHGEQHHYQALPSQMPPLTSQGICVSDTLTMRMSRSYKPGAQRSAADRSFAAAAAAASRSRCEYPIFYHHQPPRVPKASNKRARSDIPIYPQSSHQQSLQSGSTWAYQGGQFMSPHHRIRASEIDTTQAGHFYSSGPSAPQGHSQDGSSFDELCSANVTRHGSHTHLQGWHDRTANRFAAMAHAQQKAWSMGPHARGRYNHHVMGARFPELQDYRDEVQQLAFAG